MTDAPQPTAGSLEARIIRKCPTHKDCPLTCKQRQVEDLGEIASFSTAALSPDQQRSWRAKFVTWMQEASHSKGGS